MKLIKKWNSLFLLLLFILSGCSFGKSTLPEKCLPIRIGVLIADENQERGFEQKKGYEMALAEINQDGGIQGCQIELIYKNEGEETDTESAQVSVLQLADENVIAIIGGTTNNPTMRAAAIASYFKVPFLIPSPTSDEITQRGNQWIFRLRATNDTDARTAFEMVRSELGTGANVVILYEQSPYGESSAVVAATAALAQDLNVNGYFSFTTQSSDLSSLAEQVVELGPEVVYIISSGQEQTVNVLGALRSQRFSTNMMIGHGPGFTERSFLYDGNEEIFDNLNNIILVANWSTDLPWAGMDRFIEDFKIYSQQAEYNNTLPVIRNVETYTALHLVADALEGLKLTVSDSKNEPELTGETLKEFRESLTNQLRNLNADQRETLFGTVSFDGTGQNRQSSILVQVMNGKIVTVYPSRYALQSPYYIGGW
jgi:ABC-type branched-subunit amino acid transport system substrate-binding protein